MGPQGGAIAPSEVSLVIDSLKKKVDADRCAYIKVSLRTTQYILFQFLVKNLHYDGFIILFLQRRMEENRIKLAEVTHNHHKLSVERRKPRVADANQTVDLLTKRQKDAIDMQNGVNASNDDSDSTSSQEDGHASAILLGSSIAVKNAVRPIKLPEVKKLPPYTTWIFLDR